MAERQSTTNGAVKQRKEHRGAELSGAVASSGEVQVQAAGELDGGPARAQRPRGFSALWAVGGMVSFALGALGAVLPLIPTTPFLLLAAFCFARSSHRIERWFRSTKLCKNMLEGYLKKRTMTLKAKLLMLVPLTLMLGISFALMSEVPLGRMVVVSIWVAHVVYFGFVVKTQRPCLQPEESKPATTPPAPSRTTKREGV